MLASCCAIARARATVSDLFRGPVATMTTETAASPGPFAAFAASITTQSPLRAAITAQTRADEAECVARLLVTAKLPSPVVVQAEVLARRLVTALRAKGTHGAVEGLMREYALSSDEGVALMCLAEALLRIPDRATRDALIRDKTTKGDWQSHVGHSPSMFVNAATWGLLVTGKLVATNSEVGLAGALARLIARGGEPVIRKGVDIAMRMLGEQFVTGRTIAEALANSRRLEARGFRYSYDMLGEAALTAAEASRYYQEYEQAIHAIGASADGRGLYRGTRHLDQAFGPAPALLPRAAGPGDGRIAAASADAGGAGAPLRHRP